MTLIQQFSLIFFLLLFTIIQSIGQSFDEASWQQKDSMIATLYQGGAINVIGGMIGEAYQIEKEKDVQNQEALAIFSMWQGIRYLSEHNPDEAEPFLAEAIQLFASLPNSSAPRHRDALLNMADLQMQKGNTQESISMVEKALQIMEQDIAAQPSIYLATLLQAVEASIQTGAYVKAEEFSRKALNHAQKNFSNQSDEYFRALQSVGKTYLAQGETRRASNLILQAYELAKKYLPEDDLNRIFYGNNAVTILKKLGRYRSAEQTYQEMLQFFEDNPSFKNDNLFPALLDDIGTFYEEQGDLAQAYEYFDRGNVLFALRLERTDPSYIKSQINVGNVLRKQKKFTEAESYYLDALQHIKNVYGDNSWSEAILRENLAGIYFDTEQYSKSLEQREIFKEISELVWGPNHQEFATALFNLGRTHAKLGNLQQAKEFQETSWTKLTKLYGDVHLRVYEVSKSLAELYEVENPVMAIDHYNNAVEFVHYYCRNILPLYTSADRALIMQDFNQLLARFSAFILNQSEQTSSAIISLQNAFLNYKQVSQIPDLGAMATKFTAPSPELRKMYGQWQTLRQEIIDAHALTIAQRKERDLDLDQLCSQINTLQMKMLPSFNSKNCQSIIQIKNINEIKLSLKANDVLVDFNEILTYNSTSQTYSRNGTYLAFVTPGLSETKLVSINLNKNVLETDQLSNQSSYASQIWQPLSTLIPPKSRIIICPDGALHKVSFYMLPTQDGKMLINQHNICIVANLKSARLTSTSTTASKVLMMGATDYYQNNTDTSTQQASFLLKINPLDIATQDVRSTQQFTQTINSPLEINTLSAQLNKKKKSVDIKIGKEASKNELHRSLEVNTFQVLHITTSAFLIDDSDSTNYYLPATSFDRTGLALAGAHTAWSTDTIGPEVMDDGLLTSAEIQTLPLLQTELVVLPAVSGNLSTDGVALSVLKHAFIQAGAKNVIFSLWPLSEKDRLPFLQLFYKNLAKSSNVDQAFRKTQLNLKKKYDAKYWAGYQLVS